MCMRVRIPLTSWTFSESSLYVTKSLYRRAVASRILWASSAQTARASENGTADPSATRQVPGVSCTGVDVRLRAVDVFGDDFRTVFFGGSEILGGAHGV